MSIPTACASHEAKPRPRLDIGELLRTHGQLYRQSHVLTSQQHRVLNALSSCRTAALGGHVDRCRHCGHERPAFNSCRNRHCPKCQNLAQAQWLQQRMQHILPTHYFHVVFTLPGQLRELARCNQRQIYNLLLHSAAHTLLTLGQDDKWLGAQLGLTAVLHTWTRQLLYHPHVHCIVTGGGFAQSPDRWLSTRKDFLFPVNVMSALFRGHFLARLTAAHKCNELKLPTNCPDWSLPDAFSRIRTGLYRKPWVVYAKPPFGGPEHIYEYLGRYTHRVGLSNHRLVEITDRSVTFKTKHGKTANVSVEEFIRRFLLHVLPKGFVKIRHYGLMAPCNANTKLERARVLLQANVGTTATSQASYTSESPTEADRWDWQAKHKELTGIDLAICPRCHRATMARIPLDLVVGTSSRFASATYMDSS